MKTELKGKYLIAFDTICDGFQVATNDDEQPCPELFNTYDEAFKSLFEDAICGIEGNEEHFDSEELQVNTLREMKEILESGNVQEMTKYFDNNPVANYYDEFVEKADEFVLGRKTIFTGQGLVIDGKKLEELI